MIHENLNDLSCNLVIYLKLLVDSVSYLGGLGTRMSEAIQSL